MNSIFPRMHVSLYVSDLTKSLNFYTRFFAQEPAKIRTGYAKFVLETPSLIISFVENADRVQSNFGHLGFQVETIEDLHEKLHVAKQSQLLTKEEIETNCCYARQDKFWVTDPDGVQWEVYYFHEDAEFNDPRVENLESTTCCFPSDASSVVAIPSNKKSCCQ